MQSNNMITKQNEIDIFVGLNFPNLTYWLHHFRTNHITLISIQEGELPDLHPIKLPTVSLTYTLLNYPIRLP